MISTNQFKNGNHIDVDGTVFKILEFQHVKPGKGGAFVRTKLKNLRSGAVIERTYRADEKLDQAIIDKRDMQFLYRDGSDYVFMDTSNYEQMQAAPELLGTARLKLGRSKPIALSSRTGKQTNKDHPFSIPNAPNSK